MKFEWDDKKNAANLKKHGIDFKHATKAFKDPLRREYYDNKHSATEEERFILFGIVGSDVLFVNFTEPESKTNRIISARKAKKHEVEVFYYGNG